MEVDPPSAITRFGIVFLIGGLTLIFVLWGVLRYFDKPRPPVPVRPEQRTVATPSIPPLLARPSPSDVPHGR